MKEFSPDRPKCTWVWNTMFSAWRELLVGSALNQDGYSTVAGGDNAEWNKQVNMYHFHCKSIIVLYVCKWTLNNLVSLTVNANYSETHFEKKLNLFKSIILQRELKTRRKPQLVLMNIKHTEFNCNYYQQLHWNVTMVLLLQQKCS